MKESSGHQNELEKEFDDNILYTREQTLSIIINIHFVPHLSIVRKQLVVFFYYRY